VTASKNVDGSRILFSEPDTTLLDTDDKEAYHVRNTSQVGTVPGLNYEYLVYSREIHGLPGTPQRRRARRGHRLIDALIEAAQQPRPKGDA
jgi:hypothetical protein